MKSNIYIQLKIQLLLSVLITVAGTILLMFMIHVESEPGGIPVLLLILGGGSFSSPENESEHIKLNDGYFFIYLLFTTKYF